MKANQSNIIDTITAQATPSGRSGVAVVRISGPQVNNIMLAVLGCELSPRKATYLPFRDATGEIIDAGIAIYFPKPHSFTGEDVLELHGHGGPLVVDLLLQRIVNCGARLARPGEFSERAFLNNKIDLTQAEAIADLINASSKQAVRSAIRSLQGEFSKEIYALTEKVIHLRMYIEAAIDFTDEDIDLLSDGKIIAALHDILQHLATIQTKAKQGTFLREGIYAVIVGEPNVGKSSLLNAISGNETAIVTDIPGTTRDVVRESILIDGMPMHIIDTAGLRESIDVVEQEGMRRTHQEIEKADLILYVADASKNVELNITAIENLSCSIIFIQNKIDLIHAKPAIKNHQGKTIVMLSALTGAGIDLLKAHIKSHVGFQAETEGIFLARRRHLEALTKAHDSVHNSLQQLSENKNSELAAEDLRQAQLALSEITGEFTADDLLGRIFSSFCVGK